jgi:hypothetical protein
MKDDTLPLYLKNTESPNSEYIIRQRVMFNVYKKFAIYGFLIALLIFISYIATSKLLFPCDEVSKSVDDSYEHLPSYNLVSSSNDNLFVYFL